jgi:hypothetical protein
MTDTTTQTIAAMLDGVTPGPWAVEDEWDVAGPDYGVFRGAPDIKHDAESAANARFTAWARDAVPALAAERDAAIARAETAEKERESLIEAGIACCNGTPNPTIPRIDLALSFIKSTRQALKAANQVWQDYKARAEAAEARLAELEAINWRDSVTDLIAKDHKQLLSDYGVDVDIWKNDPERGEAIGALADAITAAILTAANGGRG